MVTGALPDIALLSTTPVESSASAFAVSTDDELAAMDSPALPDGDLAETTDPASGLAPGEVTTIDLQTSAAVAQSEAQAAAPVIHDTTTKFALATTGQTDGSQEAVSAVVADSLPQVWQSNFANGLGDWPRRSVGWGESNRSFSATAGIAGYAMNVFMPKGSIDPATMKNRGLPFGGTGFRSTISTTGFDIARLSYKVRFPVDFQQGMGGKMPGLCGGRCNGGGNIPNGIDGFSARYMWTGNFAASVYAYLPTSVKYGTPVGSRQIPLAKNRWIHLVQELKLNTPNRADGHIKVWADGVMVVDQQGLTFRTTANLKINGIYFDVFYGGSDDRWAAPQDTTIQFAEFSVSGR